MNNSNKSAPIVAIDFGTARVKVAYYDEATGNAKLAPLGREVREIIPALFHIGKDDVLVGDDAKERAEEDPKGLITGLKKEIHREGKIRKGSDRVSYTRVEIASKMFSYIKQLLEKELFHCVITDCVLTVPVCFEESKREKIREAAQIGGFKNVKILEESVAAGQAWLRNSAHHVDANSVIICDIGGGTTDFALLKKSGDSFISDDRVAPSGCEKGGDDLDESIAEEVQESNYGFSKSMLVMEFRSIRERLSRVNSKSVSIKNNDGETVKIDPEIIEEHTNNFIEELIIEIKRYLEKCQTSKVPEDVPVVLIGGASKINGLEERIKQETKRKVYRWVDSDYAVVLGAVDVPKKITSSSQKSESQIDQEKYRHKLEAYWDDGEISKGEYDNLVKLRKELNLSANEYEAIEKQVCNKTVDSLFAIPIKTEVPQNNFNSNTSTAQSDFKRGEELFELEQFHKAFKWFRKAAEQGNAEAQNMLGICYSDGLGVVQSDYEAVKWFSKAAEQGNAEAQYLIGIFYQNGLGVAQSDYEAVKWYLKAADQGNAEAQNMLGICYLNGQGAEQSDYKSVKWFRKAAEQGNADAQYVLGSCYKNGLGVAQSDSEAVKSFSEAAEQGDAEAQYNLGICYLNGRGVAQSDYEAIKWFRKAAGQGNAEAQNMLGFCYQNGLGVTQSDSEAVKWFSEAAEQGDAEAQYSLGICYLNGQGVTQSDYEAVKWFRKAGEQGDAEAQYNLGHFYLNGQGVAQHDYEAVKWFRKAAEQGDAEAQNMLGICYLNGQGVAQSDSEAVKWFSKAAEEDLAVAKNNLGFCYKNGLGVAQSDSEAVKWYRKAAEQGYKEAEIELNKILNPTLLDKVFRFLS